MFICPNCRQQLRRVQNELGIFWLCDTCGGRAISFGLVRKYAGDSFSSHLWSQTQTAPPLKGKQCPMCEKLMAQVTSPGMTLDLCMRCQFVWFDPAEFEAVPAKPLPPAEPQLPQKAREIIALHQVEQMARALENDPDMVPADAWKIIPAVFGYPIEDESTPLQCLPLLTWSIAGACVLMTLVS